MTVRTSSTAWSGAESISAENLHMTVDTEKQRERKEQMIPISEAETAEDLEQMLREAKGKKRESASSEVQSSTKPLSEENCEEIRAALENIVKAAKEVLLKLAEETEKLKEERKQ